ncbi:hypothetical protein [Clostridium chrysemydis]|uniref:hypothetical protein n=1 Tax=Clostridium chrysemydis TaxID=2665504 RepID=UPI00188329D8|nr:hypothetical protein [Clostridium chrysemydis]
MEDLLKKYGSKELARITYRKLQDKRNKRRRDINNFTADRMRASYVRMNDSRRKLKQW